MRSSLLVADLGPTNTGKTHRAVERMLEHETGMIGLPLRLLAREVYDRVTARVGEARVALVTGEEKRIPPHPAYWICTVEAMPTDTPVDFLAVDEIQLAAHRERGHVFTHRLLHARGLRETWFLGADTLRPLVQTLLPGVSLRHSTRLSQLRSFGRRSLKGLPPRSAVVAFSVDRVYELAESLRRLRGGVAVVLGALSPRTRNAQVAMYQAGEVQYLVATDAIGMGLNLDLDRVAFAALSKYDGFEQRDLMADELAQIAGRAGRHLNDGAFGTLSTVSELSPKTVAAIESHRFPPVRRLVWRNPALDFSSPQALLDALSRPPEHPAFMRVERADDFESLKALSRLPELRAAATDRAGVELLWEVCQIPDFRKRLFGAHVALLRDTFLQLMEGPLRQDWLAKQVSPLEDVSGDLHALTDRLAAIRIWTYISQRSRWLEEAELWQERTRRAEDALGDALHARLVERFVERAARRTPRRFVQKQPGGAALEGPFAKLWLLAGTMQVEGGAPTEERFVAQVVEAPNEAFDVDGAGRISFEGEPLARLIRGTDRRTPQVALADPELWSGGSRRRLERRLAAWTKDLVAEAMGGFPAEVLARGDPSAAVRGLAHRLGNGLGVVRRDDALEQWRLLDPRARQKLQGLGVREGQRYLWVAEALSTRALERRCLLTALFDGAPAPSGAPRRPLLDSAGWGRSDAERFGYEVLGSVALRLDVVERLATALRRPGGGAQVQALCGELGLEGSVRGRVLAFLGAGALATSKRRRRRGGRGRGPGGSRGV
jgi:ATP-dependent RNA helicase SUPV3L1/SUV3